MNRCVRPAGVLALGVAVAFAVSGRAQSPETQETATATFAAGCFWCVEEAFDKVDGVLTTTSGYIGGRTANPTYEQVSSGGTGHTEALQVTYDPSRVSYETLLRTFWQNVDPLDAGGQFCDRGSQYRSGIFYHSDEQRQQAEAVAWGGRESCTEGYVNRQAVHPAYRLMSTDRPLIRPIVPIVFSGAVTRG
jgi:methionine-S-sulfoxide reductase